MDLADSTEKVINIRRHRFSSTMAPRTCLHRENHSLLIDGKTSLRHLSEVENEEVDTEDSDKVNGVKAIVLKTPPPPPTNEVHDKKRLFSAHSMSFVSNIMEKNDMLRRPISLIIPHARKVINWATRPQSASSVPYNYFPKYRDEELFNDAGTGNFAANNRLSWRRSPNRASSGFVEDLPINQKPKGKFALNVPIPDDNIPYDEAFKDRGSFRTSSMRSVSSQTRVSAPSHLESQVPYQVGGSFNVLSREPRRGRCDSQTGISNITAADPDPLQPLRGSKHGSHGGGDISVTGVSTMSSRSMIQGSVITFRDVKYVIPIKKTPCSKAIKKIVLDEVNGIMRPGLNAIMGPTGCGKSSLLDLLAGRKDPSYLTGEVLIDGHPQPKHFKCISGYVVQDDILMGTLTVRETLYLAAMLKRQEGCTRTETHEKINEILDELGLTKIADNKIGTELVRGISGGERKRTSIGMEIIADPPVLFLDEPTTGLDAFTAGSVIQTLKTLSRRGRTIILSIHQPKYSIYKLFDSLTLMSNGKIIYHGLAHKEPVNYFLKLGYVIEDHNNPADFFLDILHGEVKPTNNSRERDEFDLESEESNERMRIVSERLTSKWLESSEYMIIQNEVSAAHNQITNETNYVKPAGSEHIGYPVSFLRQIRIVCWRTILSLIRDPQASIVQTLVYLLFAVSMGIVYFDLGKSLESGIQNRSGLFFFSTLQVVFVNIGSIELFLKERAIFIHEHSSGYYRVSAYFLAKLICDVFPTKALPVFFFMPITYWMAGLVPNVGNFFFFELILTLGTISGAAAAMVVSASVTLFSIANVIISILFVFMMVFGGFLINLNSMGSWLSWLRYFSIFNYTFGGLIVNELAGLTFCPATNRTTPTFNDTRECESGRLYLDVLGYPSLTAWDMWSNVLGLSVTAIVCFLLCYILLRRINSYK
ncbi:hypothetical protein Aperf_G00000074705 [Anoplocephala perfoliata]